MLQDEFGHEIGELYTFVPIKVAGVTFKNGRRSRQTILRQIDFHDEPYSKTRHQINLNFRQVEFENSSAIEIWVQKDDGDYEQIGFVPKDTVSFFVDNWDLYDFSVDFCVTGGGRNQSGEHFTVEQD